MIPVAGNVEGHQQIGVLSRPKSSRAVAADGWATPSSLGGRDDAISRTRSLLIR
jgi:hypothetical protein